MAMGDKIHRSARERDTYLCMYIYIYVFISIYPYIDIYISSLLKERSLRMQAGEGNTYLHICMYVWLLNCNVCHGSVGHTSNICTTRFLIEELM
jgi:hypothetical protein